MRLPNHISRLLTLLCLLVFVSSCVSKKKFTLLEDDRNNLNLKYNKIKDFASDCETENERMKKEIKALEAALINAETNLKNNIANTSDKEKLLMEELAYVKSTNTNLLDRLSDLSIINKAGAESIKTSLESINEQNKYIKDLSTNIQRKDSVNLALVMNLKRSLADINDQDVQIEVKKGVVYVSISDKLLFSSGSSNINALAEGVLSKVAKVINDHNNLDVLVEGHTDDVPISSTTVKDNWELSTNRANAVVRVLQNKHGVNPGRLTAGGRSHYAPKASNETQEGRKQNRRTEIIITPKLDEFFELMVPPGG